MSPRLGDFVALQEQQARMKLGVKSLEGVSFSKNRLELATKDGFSIQAIQGQKRTLRRLDSKYKLNSNISGEDSSFAELSSLESQIREQQTPFKERMALIDRVLASLATTRSSEDMETFKKSLKYTDLALYSELGIENLGAVNEIEAVLNKERSDLSKDIADIEARTISYANILVDNLNEKLEKKQKKQKEVLNFLYEIGFDRIPQDITDIVIRSINSNSELKSKYGLQKDIDLENASLGFESLLGDESLSQEQKLSFIKLFNKMITGDEKYPVFIDRAGILFFQSVEDFENHKPAGTLFDISQFINTRIGGNPVHTIMENLRKV